MLIQMQTDLKDYERKIIFESHVDGILQSNNLKNIRICIVGAADGIVQFQQLCFVLKEHGENT